MTFQLSAGLVLCCALGCSTSSSEDHGSHVRPKGTVGAHVWFDSSVGIELSESWAHDTWGPDAAPPTSGSRCWTSERSALTTDQLSALEQLILVPLVEACTSDGFDYFQLTVADSDGSSAVYRDTGCSYLRLPDAVAMLPQGAFEKQSCDDASCSVEPLFPTEAAAPCPQ